MNLGSLRKRTVFLPCVETRTDAKGLWALKATCSSCCAIRGQKAEAEKLWQELFSDPADWQDHRWDKVNPSFPDFTNKKNADKALWLDSKWIPSWVESRLAPKGSLALESTVSSKRALGYEGKKAEEEKLWQELFSDPAKWQDHRWDKVNPSFPDFKHQKHTEKALWLKSRSIPLWVEEKLAVLPPGSMQLSNFSRNQQLSRYVQTGQYFKTVELFLQMQREGHVDRFTFFPVLKACANLGLLQIGRLVHTMMPPGFEADIFVGNTLVDMYGKCGSMEEAERVFKQMPTRNVVTLTAMIGGYVKCGDGQKALDLFEQMQEQGVDPNLITFVGVLNACASVAALEVGRRAHEEVIRRRYDSDVVVGTCLVNMYVKCGSIKEAERVFKQMPKRNSVTYTALICGYVKSRTGKKALELFEQMQAQGVDPDPVTFVGVLKACASVPALEVGRRAHEEIIRRGYELDIVVGNCLVDMYAKCGSIKEAERVFKQMPTRDVFTLTAMISGYVACGERRRALELFEQMLGQGVDLNVVTFVGIINACAGVAALEIARRAHEEIIRRGFELDVVVGNCLVDMYAKCGSIKEAEIVFKQMPTRDVVTMTAMIGGYVKCGEGQRALELFVQMQGQAVDPDPVTFVGVLSACASVAALKVGRVAHEEIIRRGYESDVILGTSLVDMYTKCGSIEDAERVFKGMPTRNVVTWNTLLAGYGIHGYARRAVETFKEMCKVVEVNGVTFLSLLSACSHGGLVGEGLEYFKSMHSVYNITPTVEHFACVVNLLGRAGHLGEAEDLIMSMPMDQNTSVWMALLGACRAHVNMELGERCAKQVLDLELDNAAAYVWLSDIYVAGRKFDSIGNVMEREDI